MKSLPVEWDRAPVPLGARLREARLAGRYSLDEVASRSGMTKGFLSRVERDLASPSVASLVALCRVLQLEVGSLFVAPSTVLVRAASAPEVTLGGVGIRERLVTDPGETSVQVLHAVIEAGGHSEEEPYAMDCHREVWHVTRGCIEVFVNGVSHRIDEGDTLTFPGREPHSWRNPGDHEANVVMVLVPDPPIHAGYGQTHDGGVSHPSR